MVDMSMGLMVIINLIVIFVFGRYVYVVWVDYCCQCVVGVVDLVFMCNMIFEFVCVLLVDVWGEYGLLLQCLLLVDVVVEVCVMVCEL